MIPKLNNFKPILEKTKAFGLVYNMILLKQSVPFDLFPVENLLKLSP